LAILLCLELMLNAANLALVAFSRSNGNLDGQVFAIVVMVVAACEVAVGLGLIVAIYRRNLPIDVDVLPPMPGLNAKDAVTAYWIFIAPNIALFLLPNHLFTLLFRPDGTGQTLEFADMLVHPETLAMPETDAKADAIFAFWDMVNAQDIEAVERVQKGLGAQAFPGGRMCYRFEESIHRFQNMIIDLMTGRRRVPAGDTPA